MSCFLPPGSRASRLNHLNKALKWTKAPQPHIYSPDIQPSPWSHQVCLYLFCVAGDRLADSTITLALALELLSNVTTPLPPHPIPTWSPSRSNQKVDWMWPSPSGCWCTARYQKQHWIQFPVLKPCFYFQLAVRRKWAPVAQNALNAVCLCLCRRSGAS